MKGRKARGILPFLFPASLLAVACQAHAAGYAIKEQSATLLGTAFAGSLAGAEDPSYMFFNPAALAYQEGTRLELVASDIIPVSKLEKAEAETVSGTTVTGRSTKGNVAERIHLPAFYLSHALNPQWRVGLAVTAPFGLETHYPDGWVGRYHSIDSELKSVNIAPTLAFRPLPWLSLGLSLQAQYVDARLTNAVDFGSIGAAAGIPGASPAAQDGHARLDGNDWGFGYALGAIVEPWQGTRIGIGYRSEVDHRLHGRLDYTLDGAGIGAALAAATGRFVDTGASADLTTPASVGVGFTHQLTPRLTIAADATFTAWGQFDELRVRFDNPNESDSVTEEKWNGSWFYAVGATYRPSETLTFRIGAAYDESPIPNRYRTPRIPGDNRLWLAAGAAWEPSPWFSLNVGYTHIFVGDSSIQLDTTGAGNTFRANLDASYDNRIDILSLSARLRF